MKLIAVEGIDGAGKTTLIKSITPHLHNIIKLNTIQTPGGTEAGSAIRSLVKSSDIDISSNSMPYLFIADMWNTWDFIIKPTIDEPIYHITDRWWMSTLVYQSIPVSIVTSIPTPDLILFLDIHPHIAHERALARGTADNKDRFDNKGVDYFYRLRDRYKEVFRMDCLRDKVKTIYMNRPLEECIEEAMKNILAL